MLWLVEAAGKFRPGDAECDFAASGIAEAPGPQRDVRGVGALLHVSVIDRTAVRTVEIERDGAAAAIGGPRAIDACQRYAAGVLKRRKFLDESAGERVHVPMNRVQSD